MDEQAGLGNVIEGTLPLAEAIIKSSTPNLSLLSAGSAFNDVNELLLSPKFRDILVTLRSWYDIVIIDSAACAIVPDAIYIAPYVDCILQVVGLGCIDETTLMRASESLQATGIPRGVFVTRADDDRLRSDYGNYYRTAAHMSVKRATPARVEGRELAQKSED